MNGQQGGDPAKLAEALIQLVTCDEQPLRFPAGADAVDTFERRAKTLLAQADANRDLSSNLAHDDAVQTGLRSSPATDQRAPSAPTQRLRPEPLRPPVRGASGDASVSRP